MEHSDYRTRNYYMPIDCTPRIAIIPMINEEKKMESTEPKNVAVKTLVDKLKVEQAGLASVKSTLDIYKDQQKKAIENIKIQNKAKADKEKAIKELSVALKKLGHKE